MTSLEGWGSAIELRPHVRWKLCLGTGEHGQRTGSGHRRRTVAAGRGGPRHKGRLVHWPWLDSFGRRCRISAVTASGGSCEALRRLGSRPMDGRLRIGSTGCGAAWLARLLWEQEAAGSNPAIPTNLSLFFNLRVRDRLLMAGWRSRSTGQDGMGQLALSAVAVAFLIAAIWLGGKLTYRYGIRVPRRADHDGSSA
jgi:hypothetical protein